MKVARHITAGVLAGYGFVSFFCFIVLDILWSGAAPRQPNPVLGFVYRHNEHGSFTYFSQFQTTTCAVMFMTSIPLAFIGVLIAPKKKINGIARWWAADFKWDRDDPGKLIWWTFVGTALLTPLFVFFVGPRIVDGLNAFGFVMNFG
jgi:hypothetical protein